MASSTGSLCAVDGCRSSKRRDKHLSFFFLPADRDRRESWLELIGRPDLLGPDTKINSHFVCSLHFDSSVITYIPKLRPNALPSKLLPSGSSTGDTIIDTKTKEISTQTIDSFLNISASSTSTGVVKQFESIQTEDVSYTVRKRKQNEDLKESNPKRRKRQEKQSSEQFTFNIDDEKTKEFLTLLKCQSYLRTKQKGNHYDADFKLFALKLYFSRPHIYRSFKSILLLPSESDLHKFKMIIPPEFDYRVLDFLSAKLKSMPENAKYCTLCIDEIALKEHLHYDIKRDEMIGLHNINGDLSPEIASHACVIMLRGIIVDWQLAIGYSLLGFPNHYQQLEQWIEDIILKVSNIGIKVEGIVSNQESNFNKYVKQVQKITKEKPYFFYNGKKVFYIFDVPHLINCVRNSLMSINFIYDDQIISWDYIETLYSQQNEKDLPLLPKITDVHIKPNNFQKRRTKYGMQIFSNSVYTALNILIFQNSLPEEARATAEFIQKMNNLIDILNSSSIKTNSKFKKAFSLEKYQLDILQDAMVIFNKMKPTDITKCVDNTNIMETFKNLQITIQSIIMLFKNLNEEGFDYIFTRRLNLDCLDNFFSNIKRQESNRRHPTPIQFKRAFSKLFLSNMLKSWTADVNYEDNICELLAKEVEILENSKSNNSRHTTLSTLSLNGETDYRFDLPPTNALLYISGYLLHKCNMKHSCPGFQSELRIIPDLNESRSLFKDYNKSFTFYGQLKVPPVAFYNYIEALEAAFIKLFAEIMTKNPGKTIFEHLKNIPFIPLCPCFPKEYLLKLFVRLRIFSATKYNNCEFRQQTKYNRRCIKIEHL